MVNLRKLVEEISEKIKPSLEVNHKEKTFKIKKKNHPFNRLIEIYLMGIKGYKPIEMRDYYEL